ncbi:hypothetical protein BSZ39_06540 [Bowdeniella nasicola]|uniref:Fe/B12 periplasmic-binding domain-containing protein n=1 Tax=Bowdeniella nasicola TaxID=208480 RepID=A0A1Q5Q2C2_9ACTO|nr:ABC transporter substrate-binding protein [Bowdeniella nasicola]OKL53957.1 hypothetical protein BSZ39_06540 [Bowdeniella nasicola]
MKPIVGKIAAAVCAASLLLAGCSKAQGADKPDSSEKEQVSITHAWGTDTYPANPKKIVALGTAVDNLLALGITPDAVIEAPLDKNAPWRSKELASVKRIEVTDFATVPTEQVAALEPDVIIGDFWRITEENYQALSKIAPTLGAIGKEGEDLGWKKQITALGTLFNKSAEAEKVITDDQALFQKAKDEMPKLAGKTGLIAQYVKSRGIGVVTDPKEPGNSFLYDLGMKVPESVLSLPGRSGRAIVSAENISVLDADFMAIYAQEGSEADLRATPGFAALRQVASGGTYFGDTTLVQAINDPSSRSRAWALDQLREMLAKVEKAD